MSSDIYAKPDLSKKVRYNRKKQKDEAEWEQREVEIYQSTDVDENICANFQSQEGGPESQNLPPVQKGSFRNATLGLTVLCLLMLAGIVILSTYYILVTLENQQLKKAEVSEKWCPEEWTRFGCSCYFKSTEEKSWSQSRRDCWDKGANLVIINSEEEQKFIHENMRDESWIGLRATRASRRYEWKWVDGSPLTETFWGAGWSHPRYGSYAVCCDSDGKWTQSQYYKSWICEK